MIRTAYAFTLRTVLAALFATLLLAQTAHAHRVTIFAWEEDGAIHTESTFSGGKKARDSKVVVSDAASGKEILTGTTDDNGLFTFPIPAEAKAARMDLKIDLYAGVGHAGQWIIAADEYLGEAETAVGTATAQSADATPQPAPVAPAAGAQTLSGIDEATLTRIVEHAVDRKLAPIARKLAEEETAGPGAVEIFGGIGYIFGLFGVAALVRSRRNP
ncbi:nickel transport protein [Desulfobaculum xiamenense]|uniref:Nickel transport protein n=1 Tax=Desulfobaculum xiamenense TaxID=995050 RepID=A0A846QR34_9BACT|nr:hypothetical protein [Desulfobaculum xiamenense]NJB67119.1 nickel transport protein [Desulfobaculum xiamenense]